MNSGRPVSVQELEKTPEIKELDLAVRKYLQSHPPSLGHGYSHFKKVAWLCFQLALDNHYQDPELAYICGLVHDLYRPARGKAGQEKHAEKTAGKARKLLEKTALASRAEEVVAVLLGDGEEDQEENKGLLKRILSTADKIEMSFQRAVAYTWASNRYLEAKGKVAYKSFLETMRDFCLYQIKAWKFFLAIRIKGRNRAIEAYLHTHEDLIQALRDELAGEVTYQDKCLELAKKEAALEKEFLTEAGATEEEIQKISNNFEELI